MERSDRRGFVAALRSRDVLHALVLVEAADLLGDVFHGFIALYFVGVAHTGPVEAALAVAIWTGGSFAGDVLLLPLLRRVSGRSWLQVSSLLVLAAYPAFLVLPGAGTKLALLAVLGLLNAGWYAIPKAALYDALPGRSGTAIAAAGVAGLAGSCIPAGLGFVAGWIGLGPTMWLLLAAPVALLCSRR
jgi:MFS transporter, FSR family, fosmidomycin resistance protein